jgi:hypothetical protein
MSALTRPAFSVQQRVHGHPVITDEDSFMHSRSRHVLPRLRESVGKAATIATKPAVRYCIALVLG